MLDSLTASEIGTARGSVILNVLSSVSGQSRPTQDIVAFQKQLAISAGDPPKNNGTIAKILIPPIIERAADHPADFNSPIVLRGPRVCHDSG